MRVIDLIQGSPEWHAHRNDKATFNASDAPAMLGVSKYKKRTDLLKEKATGIMPEVDPATQRRFDAGHASEAAARPIVEAHLGEDLFPVIGVESVDGMNLSASFDGITMLGDIIWENKLLNGDLKADVAADELAPHYWSQLEHQLLVSGAEKAYFTTSDGTEEGTHGTWYVSQPERRAKVIAGWKQFAEDLANYQHVEAKPAAVAATIEALPALLVQVEGRVVSTNMDVFKAKALDFISKIKAELRTDQDFVDADKMAKFLRDGEVQLDAVKAQAQAQAISLDEAFKAIDYIKSEMRTARLKLEKLVEAEKVNRKTEIINAARVELGEHYARLNGRIGGNFMPSQNGAAFADAVKGLKTLDSMRDKVATALANMKIEANEIADTIETNRKALVASNRAHLFPDFSSVCTKATDDFAGLIAVRAQQEDQRKQAEAEAQRKREEAARAQAEQNTANMRAAIDAETGTVYQAPSATVPEGVITEEHKVITPRSERIDPEMARLKLLNKVLIENTNLLLDAMQEIVKVSKKGSKAHTIASDALAKVEFDPTKDQVAA